MQWTEELRVTSRSGVFISYFHEVERFLTRLSWIRLKNFARTWPWRFSFYSSGLIISALQQIQEYSLIIFSINEIIEKISRWIPLGFEHSRGGNFFLIITPHCLAHSTTLCNLFGGGSSLALALLTFTASESPPCAHHMPSSKWNSNYIASVQVCNINEIFA